MHFSHPYLGTCEVVQFFDLGYLKGTHSGGWYMAPYPFHGILGWKPHTISFSFQYNATSYHTIGMIEAFHIPGLAISSYCDIAHCTPFWYLPNGETLAQTVPHASSSQPPPSRASHHSSSITTIPFQSPTADWLLVLQTPGILHD